MIRVQPQRQYQLRRACDRCHRSKLRCLRDNDEEPCQRCLTAQVECCSSPASRPQRRSRDGPIPNPNPKLLEGPKTSHLDHPTQEPDYSELTWNAHSHSFGEMTAAPSDSQSLFYGVDMDLDLSVELARHDNSIVRSSPVSEPFPASSHSRVPSTSIPTSSATTSTATSETAPSSVQGPFSVSPENVNSPNSSDQPVTPSLTSYMRKLSDINITLMEHLNAIPEIGYDGKAADQEDGSNDKPKYAIDEVFNLSQLFIDIISDLVRKLPPPLQNNSVSPLAPSMLTLDAASELVIFSSYLRLIETYDRILRHIQACYNQGESNPASEYQLKLPGWSIGSFSISSKSKTQSLFMVHLMETMLTRSRDLVSELSAPKATYGWRGDWECFGGMSLVIVSDLALQAIRTRERGTLRLVQQIKNAFVLSTSCS